ncbi:phospholipase B1, membrane-associated-like [Tubulanus polymorphus]|uniref:phospholipase B1, membrane-associated-like n=1 Tax=Tubulanus polymorphus TaxID=672921 RepID=UPI003DA5AA52
MVRRFLILAVVIAVWTPVFTSDSFSRKLLLALEKIQSNDTLIDAFEAHVRLGQEKKRQTRLVAANTWPCPLPKDQSDVPTSVHRLKPRDVKVIGAIGDSITAGNGLNAWTVIGLLIQYRGYSWSIGGDKKYPSVPTLANFLRLYNPDITGYSLKTGSATSRYANLNVAVPGSKAIDMPGQARVLVDKMKRDSSIDFQNDWKIITLFIGGNDLCDSCDDKDMYAPAKYIGYIRDALDVFHAEVPRAFVNLVEILDVSALSEVRNGLICPVLHSFLCACASYPANAQAEEDLKNLVKSYQRETRDLVASGRYDTKDDFTVVLQPFFRDTKPPLNSRGKPDLSYFAPDCFHFSDLGHAAAAEALWNNMVEPEGEKRTDWKLGEPLECPESSFPYFSTSKNNDQVKAARAATVAAGKFGVSRNARPSLLRAQQESSESTDHSSSSFTGGVIGGVVLLVCLAGIIFGVVLYRRRTNRARSSSILKDSAANTVTYSNFM